MSAAGRARTARLLLWVVPAMWSSNYVIARFADGVIAPHALAQGRWTLALLLMLPFVWRALVREPEVLRAEWRQMLVLGALGMWICGAWVYVAGQHTTATNMALIYAVAPVAIAVAGVKLLHERMTGAQRIAVGFALAGVLFVISRGDPRQLLQLRFNAGDLWIAAATASWIAYSILLKRWPSRLDPASRLTGIIAGGVIVLLPFSLAEWWLTPTPAPSLEGAGLIVIAAVLPGVLSYTAYSYLQRELGASRTALLLYLAPVYGALNAWIFLGEVPGWHHAVGALLILPAIWLATRR